MTNVMILAAGDISKRLAFLKTPYISPALIPVHTRVLASYVIEFYSGFSDHVIFLCVNETYADPIKSELSALDFPFEVFPLPHTKSVVETLKYCLLGINNTETTIVNVVTTIPTQYPRKRHVLIDRDLDSTINWSGVIIEQDQSIRFVSKNDANCRNMQSYAFTGVFHVYTGSLVRATQKLQDSNDLLNIVEEVHAEDPLCFEHVEWIDCGHESNYYDAKSKLLASRSFNALAVKNRTILVKRSTEKLKLHHEALYLQMLPPDISHYFPRVIRGISETENEASFEMEYYGYPNVAEILLYWDVSNGIWKRMFDHLFEILLTFKSSPYSIGAKAHLAFYKEKFFSRVFDFFRQVKEKNDNNDAWLYNPIIVNGCCCRPLHELRKFIDRKFESLYSEDDFCIIHGDFCFNNILYDIPSGVVKLVDPRGSFGDRCVGIYGDQKYDLAKLLHSTIGHYDYLANNKFSVSHAGDEFNYHISLRKQDAVVEKLSLELVERLGYDIEDIRFIMCTLFLSMASLHKESYIRQRTMYLHGLKYLNELYEPMIHEHCDTYGRQRKPVCPEWIQNTEAID